MTGKQRMKLYCRQGRVVKGQEPLTEAISKINKLKLTTTAQSHKKKQSNFKNQNTSSFISRPLLTKTGRREPNLSVCSKEEEEERNDQETGEFRAQLSYAALHKYFAPASNHLMRFFSFLFLFFLLVFSLMALFKKGFAKMNKKNTTK